MSTVSNISQLLIAGVMEGYVSYMAPLSAFSYALNQDNLTLNDSVRIPFVSAQSASYQFVTGTGYTGNNGQIVGKNVTLNNLLYQKLDLTDQEIAVLSDAAVTAQGRKLGAKLAVDVISSSFASTILAGAANFPTSASFTGVQYSSSAALPSLDIQATSNNWPDGEKFLIAGPTLWGALLNNTLVQNAYSFGGAEAVREGKIPQFFGYTPYKVNFTLPNTDTGFACTPNALAIVTAYNAPAAESSNIVRASKIQDPVTGLTIGYREWYDPTLATVKRVFDCLSGASVGDSNALIHIK